MVCSPLQIGLNRQWNLVYSGLVYRGLVWSGLGLVWSGLVWCFLFLFRSGIVLSRLVWFGLVWYFLPSLEAGRLRPASASAAPRAALSAVVQGDGPRRRAEAPEVAAPEALSSGRRV